MKQNRCYRFTHTLSRHPGESVCDGLRAEDLGDPDPKKFAEEHASYLAALQTAGVETQVLPKQEDFPDSVFVEDPALCLDDRLVILRPGAASRFGEAALLAEQARGMFSIITYLDGPGFVDGGDILLTNSEALIGLSERTDKAGVDELQPILAQHAYQLKIVTTPPGVLHFKSDCALLDQETIFSTRVLAESGCFDGYRVIHAPQGEEAAANLIRVNDFVIMRKGFPKTLELLQQHGYQVLLTGGDEAARIDGGLSCMSLRYSR